MSSSAIRKLGQHTSLYIIGTAVGTFASFLLLPLYTRYLSPADFGALEMISITVALVASVLGAGLSSAMIRYWNKYEDAAEKRDIVSTAVTCTLLLAALGIGLALIFNPLLARAILGNKQFTFALELQFLATFFEISLVPPLDYIRARQRSGWFVAISFARSLANMALTIYLIAFRHLGILGAIWANVAIGGLAFLLLLAYILQQVGGLRISRPHLQEMLRYGLPLVPTLLAVSVLHYTSRYLVRGYLGLYEVGLFALALKIASTLQAFIISPLNQVWSWQMFEVMKQEKASRTIGRVMTYYVAAAVFFSVLVSVLARDLLMLVADKSYWNADAVRSTCAVVPLLMLGLIFYGAAWIAATGFYIKEKTGIRVYLVVAVAVLNIGFNTLLIPFFHLYGAAAAGAISFLVLLISTLWVAQRILPVDWEIGRCVHALVVGVILTWGGLLIGKNSPGLWPGVLLRGGIGLSFPFLLALTGFFSPEELRALRQRRKREPAPHKPRALLISYYFPPAIEVGGRRPARFAKYLPRLGWEVWVLSLQPEASDGVVSRSYCEGTEVVQVSPWLKKKAEASCTSAASPSGQEPPHHGILRSLKRLIAESIGMRLNEILWVYPAIRTAKKLVREHDIEVIFSTCFPFTCHMVGAAVKRSTHRPWVADYRDPWSNFPRAQGNARWQQTLRGWIEKHYVRHADYITVVNEPMRQYILQKADYLDPARAFVVTNGFDAEDFAAARSLPMPATDGKMVITHTGMLGGYRPADQLMEAFSRAVKDGYLPPDQIELRLVGIEDAGDGKSVRQLVAEHQLEQVVKIIGTVPHQQALAFQLASDLLLYLQPKTAGREIFAAAKTYEYLGAGRPILAISEELEGVAVLRNAGGATIVSFDQPEEILQALHNSFLAWQEGKLQGTARAEKLAQYEEPNPTRNLAELLSKLREARY